MTPRAQSPAQRCKTLCRKIYGLQLDIDQLVQTTPEERQHYDFKAKGEKFDPASRANVGSHLIGNRRRFTTDDMWHLQGLADELAHMRVEAKGLSANLEELCNECDPGALDDLQQIYTSFKKAVDAYVQRRDEVVEEMRAYIARMQVTQPPPSEREGSDVQWLIDAVRWVQNEGVLYPGIVTSGDIMRVLETPSRAQSVQYLVSLFGGHENATYNFKKFFDSTSTALSTHGIVQGAARTLPVRADLRSLIFRRRGSLRGSVSQS